MKKIVIASLLVLSSVAAFAVTTEVLRFNTFDSLLPGDPTGVEINSEGVMRPGPRTERFDLKIPSIWSSTVTSGGKAFIGAGNSGKVFVKEGNEYKEIFDTKALAISALVEGKDGGIYAAAAPGGEIFRLNRDGSDGKSFAKLPDKYVWSLVVGSDGTLYAGTGGKGNLYSIDKSGKFTSVIEAKGDHVVTLVANGDGILVGTSKGVIYRVSKGVVSVVFQFPGREIGALVPKANGELYVGINSSQVKAQPPQAVRPQGQEDGASEQRADEQGNQGGQQQGGAMAIYLIYPQGSSKLLMRVGGMFLTDMGLLDDESLLISTGPGGRIIRLDKNLVASLWTDVKESVVTSLVVRSGKIALYTTSSPGVVYETGAGRDETAVYTSELIDAKFISKWGRITWKAAGAVTVETRSGNTSNPKDKTWSEWKPVSGSGDLIQSSSSRFIQFRVSWAKSDAQVTDIRIAYRPANQAPIVVGIEITAGGAANKPPSPGGEETPSRPEAGEAQQGKVGIRWKSENPDGDAISYKLEFRREGTDAWIFLADDLTPTRYAWDVTGVTDGWYRVKVTVTDEISNPPTMNMTDYIISEPFLVDNSRPVVADLKVSGTVVTGTASDGFSRISEIAYSLDGGKWIMIYPDDGILDQERESFNIDLGKLPSGAHHVAIRVTDDGGNQGAGGVDLTVK